HEHFPVERVRVGEAKGLAIIVRLASLVADPLDVERVALRLDDAVVEIAARRVALEDDLLLAGMPREGALVDQLRTFVAQDEALPVHHAAAEAPLVLDADAALRRIVPRALRHPRARHARERIELVRGGAAREAERGDDERQSHPLHLRSPLR